MESFFLTHNNKMEHKKHNTKHTLRCSNRFGRLRQKNTHTHITKNGKKESSLSISPSMHADISVLVSYTHPQCALGMCNTVKAAKTA